MAARGWQPNSNLQLPLARTPHTASSAASGLSAGLLITFCRSCHSPLPSAFSRKNQPVCTGRSHRLARHSAFPHMRATLSFVMEIIVHFSTPDKFMSGRNMVTIFCSNSQLVHARVALKLNFLRVTLSLWLNFIKLTLPARLRPNRERKKHKQAPKHAKPNKHPKTTGKGATCRVTRSAMKA